MACRRWIPRLRHQPRDTRACDRRHVAKGATCKGRHLQRAPEDVYEAKPEEWPRPQRALLANIARTAAVSDVVPPLLQAATRAGLAGVRERLGPALLQGAESMLVTAAGASVGFLLGSLSSRLSDAHVAAAM